LTYDNAGRLLEDYERFCHERGLPFEQHLSLEPPDDTTLFCTAGMQRYKTLFRDRTHQGTVCNVQRCLRLSDLDEIEDGRHWLSFDMLGMFSFRQLMLGETIDLWWEWLGRVGIRPEVVTVHPDRSEWERYHRPYDVEVRLDSGCTWSDGEVAGYCTEFYVGEVEIGNIVQPLGDCIDVGFGLDRLGVLLGDRPPDPDEVLQQAVQRLLDSGYRPGPRRQGYVLRRLVRQLVRRGQKMTHPVWEQEVQRQQRLQERYQKLLEHHPDKPPEWWWETHGIEVD
jgi:alanyl-tRNA synthetase